MASGNGKSKKQVSTPHFLFQEILKERKEYWTEEIDTDSTDGAFDLLENLTNRLQEDFDELIGEDTDKKRFVKALT